MSRLLSTRSARLLAVVSSVSALLLVPASGQAAVVVAPGGATPGTSLNFKLVGHNPLFGRGMNAAMAIFDHFLYVGNRSDGSNSCGDLNGAGPIAPVLTPTNPDGTCTHAHPGILIVDIEDPTAPTVVGEIPTSVAVPNAAGQPVGVTSRELRVWPEKKLLIELSFRCSRVIHACPRGNDTTFPFEYKFFDLSDPVHPQLIGRHVTKSADGKTTYLPYLRGGTLVLDTSDVVNNTSPGTVISLNDKLLTPIANRPIWGAGNHCTAGTSLGCSESHSAVKVPGRPFEVNIDEVYGKFTDPSFGWPWGWMRIIDVRDPAHPHIVSEYKIFQNTDAFMSQGIDPDTQNFTSYSTHNP